jgi:hypothetical protein
MGNKNDLNVCDRCGISGAHYCIGREITDVLRRALYWTASGSMPPDELNEMLIEFLSTLEHEKPQLKCEQCKRPIFVRTDALWNGDEELLVCNYSGDDGKGNIIAGMMCQKCAHDLAPSLDEELKNGKLTPPPYSIN